MRVDVTWRGNEIVAAVKRELKQFISGEAEEILRKVNNEFVPFRDSDLMGSGDTDAEVTSNDVVASIFYDTPYAVKMHEHPEYDFGNGRKGKYLEDEINDRNDSFFNRFRAKLLEIFNRG